MAQVQLRHWRASGLLDGMRPTPRRLALVRDWQANDRACESFLRARSALGMTAARRLTRLYTRRRPTRFRRAPRGGAAADRRSARGRRGQWLE
jgi:hypothetical protein